MNINDRMTKVLLTLIAVALWGLLLRPLVLPSPAQAQAGGLGGGSVGAWTPPTPAMQIVSSGGVAFVLANGKVSAFRVSPNSNSVEPLVGQPVH